MGLEDEKKRTNVVISKEEITPSTFVPKRRLWHIAFDYSNQHAFLGFVNLGILFLPLGFILRTWTYSSVMLWENKRLEVMMKVNIVVEPGLEEEYAELHVKVITDEISRLSEIIQNESQVINGKDEYDRIVVIEKADIVAIHAEKKWCRIYTDSANYSCRKRLYEIENMLGKDYMRISKSIIVNPRKIESVEAVFNGMLLLRMKNGSKEYVSRNYLSRMKEYLGI